MRHLAIIVIVAICLSGCVGGLLETADQLKFEAGGRCLSGYPADSKIAGCTKELNRLVQQSDDPAARQASIAVDLVIRGGAYMQKGDKVHAFEDYDSAIAATDEAIRLKMGDKVFAASMLANRADAHRGKGDYAAAMADLDQAAELQAAASGK